MDNLSCPVCGNALKLKYRLRFNVYECSNCGLLHSDAEFEHSFQSNLESNSRDIGLKQLRLGNFKIITEELQKLKAEKKDQLHGLEIGTGNGWWLETCQINNIDCIGIEPEHIYENYHKEKKLNIIYGFYPEVSPRREGGYDFIIFNDVFEHIPDINGLVESLKKDLAEDGILIINLPVSTGFFYKTGVLLHKLGMSSSLTRLWQFNFHSPHMNYFNAGNLKMLLEKHQFSCLSIHKLNTLDFTSIKERIMADSGVSRMKASLMTAALTLMKPIVNNAEPDTKVFFFKKA